MKIKRINDYVDDRFLKRVLEQHGAYLIDNRYPCQFLISSINEAIIYYHDYSYIEEIINEFRFHSKHITRFYDSNKKLIREYQNVSLERVNINQLQPSQFFVDKSKLTAISSWAKNNIDFIIPVLKEKNDIIILDGHTRLFHAYNIGIEEIYIYEDNTDESIYYFVDEAKRRNIYSIKNLQLLTHEDYVDQWHRFCDSYFNN